MQSTRHSYANCGCTRQISPKTAHIREIIGNIMQKRDADKKGLEIAGAKTDIIRINSTTHRIQPKNINNLFHQITKMVEEIEEYSQGTMQDEAWTQARQNLNKLKNKVLFPRSSNT